MTNPAWRQIRGLGDEINRIGEAFGMSPLWRLRLGVTVLPGRANEKPRAKPPWERGPIPLEQARRMARK